VTQVRENETQELFAMKHVLQNKKYKNRELDILQQVHHENVVRLHHSFFMEEKQGTFLNLVMEYVPDTLSKGVKNAHATKTFLPGQLVRAYTKGLLSALQYLHVSVSPPRKTTFATATSSLRIS
jgi:glycogen synthase kinase 3 beta